jgi:hypothetical protein
MNFPMRQSPDSANMGTMGRLRWWAAAGFLGFCLWHAADSFLHRPVTQPPGVLAPDPPRQSQPARDPSPVRLGKFTLTPLADFEVTARLLSRERYRFDRSSALSPIDFALGWGPMSDSAVLDQIDIEQGVRWFWWRSRTMPVSPDEVARHATNVHLIPMNDSVRADLLRLRPGQVVTLVGQLVSVNGDDGFTWHSSLSRVDTGPGSCEVLYVEKAFPRFD